MDGYHYLFFVNFDFEKSPACCHLPVLVGQGRARGGAAGAVCWCRDSRHQQSQWSIDPNIIFCPVVHPLMEASLSRNIIICNYLLATFVSESYFYFLYYHNPVIFIYLTSKSLNVSITEFIAGHGHDKNL